MPKLSRVALENLERDARVQGKRWNETYGGYFGDPIHIRSFVRATRRVLDGLPDKPRILYAGSGPGLLGEAVCEYLRSKGKTPELVLVDVSGEHLAANPNPATLKVKQDLLHLELPGPKFDLALMRSTLDYFPNEDEQRRVLSNVASHLADGGVLLHQPVQLPDAPTRDLMDAVYASTRQIGRRHFHVPADLERLHREAGFSHVRRLGFAAPLRLAEQEHVQRYGISTMEIRAIHDLIGSGTHHGYLKSNAIGYKLKFDFPILAARKTKK